MTRDELKFDYFDWMYGLVCDTKYPKKLSYRKLLNFLHNMDFTYQLTMDSNRFEDGIELRYRFGYCIKLVNKMQFKSEENSNAVKNDDAKLVFYDIEVFPNLFLVNWKIEGEGKPVVRMINPTPSEIEELIQLRLVGFNCRRYDNHIMYSS